MFEKQNQADSKREMGLDERYRSAVAWARSELNTGSLPPLLYGLNFSSPASMLLKTLLIRQTDHGFYFRRVSARTLGQIVNALQTDEATYDLCQYLIAAGDLYEARRAMAVEIDGEYIGYRALNAVPGQLRLVASLVRHNVIRRPKRRGAAAQFHRDFCVFLLVRGAAERFQLTPTRAPSTRPRMSACDAVREAMRLEGDEPPSFDALRRIWQNRDLRDYIARYELGERMNDWETQTEDEDEDPFADDFVDDEDGPITCHLSPKYSADPPRFDITIRGYRASSTATAASGSGGRSLRARRPPDTSFRNTAAEELSRWSPTTAPPPRW